ncbi:MAG: type II toxin-antitoxin system RelE/ParE family toxin [Verrucomicrobia bacterium]|nr:type II toxin-antitoxin system RelE/ParE family toxin [Verrucomicrobiota bacterium]
MKIVILPSARDDLADGFDFYERQREGLGDYFQESLFSDIESLQLYAGIHLKAFGFHRLLSKRFPYAAYYDIEEQTIRIWGVLDCRQDPKSIRRRLLKLRK